MKKMLSTIFMIAGTTIGGGMVMLPAIVGIYGYYTALAVLVGVWLINTLIALVFLEANCYLPQDTNFISISRRLLGRSGEFAAWIVCLIFLYTIMCAYTTGMTEIVSSVLERNAVLVPSPYLSVLSVATIGLPLYFGMQHIDVFNRFIVMAMFVAFVALIFFIAPHVHTTNLLATPMSSPASALPLVFTSFGFIIIIPSLRTYLDNDIKRLKTAIIVGSAIPLVIYMSWVTVVMGAIPVLGGDGLEAILTQAEPVKGLATTLISHTGTTHISFFIQVFILFGITSSFVGTALGLYDFLADGLNINKTPTGKLKLLSLTFLPPLAVTLLQSNIFMTALGFAGLMSTILFGLYPAILAWSGRYVHKLETPYRMAMNRVGLILIVGFSFVLIGLELLSMKAKFL